MKRKKVVLISVIGIAVVSVAAGVTATSQGLNTPLYTVRMEQASTKMNFLPTEMNEFVYTAEKGYTVDYDLQIYEYTGLFIGGVTCQHTCPYTCEQTCPAICPDTVYTCKGHLCPQTYWNTCWQTCPVICPDTT